jgi:uncharacterized protein YjbJ (UPF0337 family)
MHMPNEIMHFEYLVDAFVWRGGLDHGTQFFCGDLGRVRRSPGMRARRAPSRPGTNWIKPSATRRMSSDLSLQSQPLGKGVAIMSGKTDVVKGRIKEAAGAVTGNDKLRDEGKTDQAVGKTKQAVQKVADTVKKAVKNVVG